MYKTSYQKKAIFQLFYLLIIVIIGTSAYLFHAIVEQEKKGEVKYQQATIALLANVADQQDKYGLKTKVYISTNNEEKEIIFQPQKNEQLSISNTSKKLRHLEETLAHKHHEKEVVTIAKVNVKAVTAEVFEYSLQADSYIWNRETNTFDQPDEIKQDNIYISKKTNKALTMSDLVPDQGSLLSIQQVIQQKILDQSKNPSKIIDAVLDMDRITFASKITYTPEAITIDLPKNDTKFSQITIDYKDIAAFINTDLVKADCIKNSVPVLDKNKKYVALTFDDGPNHSSTLDLLNILKENDVKATFFMIGQHVEQYPDVVKKIATAGHEIGSHSYTHPQLNTLSTKNLKNEIYKTDKAIFNVTGKLPRNIRPPYGAIDEQSAETIGMPVIQWDIDTMDWQSKNPAKTEAIVQQNIFDGAIILIHDIYPESVAAVPNIIRMLKDQGYTFVTIDQLLSGKQQPLHQYFGKSDVRIIR